MKRAKKTGSAAFLVINFLYFLYCQRKTVETVFSSLEKLGCQNFNSRSVKGLESRFESILLAYSVLLSRAQRRFEGTLRYSLGY